jgi:hypothetical protein
MHDSISGANSLNISAQNSADTAPLLVAQTSEVPNSQCNDVSNPSSTAADPLTLQQLLESLQSSNLPSLLSLNTQMLTPNNIALIFQQQTQASQQLQVQIDNLQFQLIQLKQLQQLQQMQHLQIQLQLQQLLRNSQVVNPDLNNLTNHNLNLMSSLNGIVSPFAGVSSSITGTTSIPSTLSIAPMSMMSSTSQYKNGFEPDNKSK